MIFPDYITGPFFSEGDIVNFSFDDAELFLSLPVIPKNSDEIDRVCHQKNFKGVSTDSWPLHGDIPQQRLVIQSWVYEDAITHLDVAACHMKITVSEHTLKEIESCYSLHSETFMRHNLDLLTQDVSLYEPEMRPGWPSPENAFFAKPINDKNILDGFQFLFDLVNGDHYPQHIAYIPLNKRFTLSISFSLRSMHYADRKNPYSEELLHKLKLDLFADFLANLRVEYSGETLEIIKKLRAQADRL